MIPWTTPTIVLTISGVEGLDLSQAEEVIVTLKQGDYSLEKTGNDLTLDGNKITIVLSEEESSQLLADHSCMCQVNWTYLNADQSIRRAATNITRIDIGRQLHQEGMTE